MSDAQWLAVIVAVVYLGECILWIRNGGVRFHAPDSSEFGVEVPRETFAVLRGALVMSAPLPPLGAEFVVPAWPVSLAPEGVLTHVGAGPGRAASPASPRLIPWSALTVVDVAGVEVRTAPEAGEGQIVAVCCSEAAALRLAEAIEIVAAAAPGERADAIGAVLDESFDHARAERALADWRSVSGSLRIAANAHFVLVALLVAALAGAPLLQPVWTRVALIAVPVHAMTVWLARRVHRRLQPDAASARRRLFWITLLSPISAIRSGTAAARDLFVASDPLVVASLVCDPDTRRDFALRTIADLRTPALPVCPADGAAPAVEAWFRDAWRVRAERYLAARGIDLDALLAPPPRSTDRTRSWCPRCRTRYDIPPGACADCGGVPLISYDVHVARDC